MFTAFCVYVTLVLIATLAWIALGATRTVAKREAQLAALEDRLTFKKREVENLMWSRERVDYAHRCEVTRLQNDIKRLERIVADQRDRRLRDLREKLLATHRAAETAMADSAAVCAAANAELDASEARERLTAAPMTAPKESLGC